MKSNDHYGKQVAELRIKSGLTQKELAEKMDIPFTLISDYERGKLRLHDEIIVKMAQAMSVSADEILGLTPRTDKNQEISLRFVKRIKKIEELSDFKQKIILQMIDSYLRGELPE